MVNEADCIAIKQSGCAQKPWRVEVKPALEWIWIGNWRTEELARAAAIEHYERFTTHLDKLK